MKMMKLILFALCFLVGLFTRMTEAVADDSFSGYCKQMNLIDDAPIALAEEETSEADYILVSKSRKKLYLLNQGKLVKEYAVSFGFGYENGHKVKEGDGRTPEGIYHINFKNSQSKYHLALRISYPNKADNLKAKKLKVSPGGDIMVHGFPSSDEQGFSPDFIKEIHTTHHWTQGCIAVTDEEIEEIYSLVKQQTPIEICSLSDN